MDSLVQIDPICYQQRFSCYTVTQDWDRLSVGIEQLGIQLHRSKCLRISLGSATGNLFGRSYPESDISFGLEKEGNTFMFGIHTS